MDEGFKQSEKMLNELEAKIHKEYAQAYKEMEEKVVSYYAKFKKQDDIQRAKYEAGEISKQQYADWRMRKMATGKQYIQMRNTLVEDLSKTAQIAMKYADDKAIDVYALNMNYGTYSIEHDSRIDTSFTLYNHEAVERMIKDNPDLLPQPKPDSIKAERWNRQHLQSAITQGLLQGESIPKIAKRMQRVANMDRSAAIRNARTAMTGAQNGGRLDAMKRAQERGIAMKKGWLATLDGRTRDSHAVMDGEEVELDKPFSNKLMFPGDASGAPAEVYNCRCRMVHVFDKYRTDWSNLENRNTENLGNMSYEEWKDKHQERLDKKKAKIVPKTIQNIEKTIKHSKIYQTIVDNIIKDYKIDYRKVEDLPKEISEKQIIDKIGGGDLTKGSCSSLSYCYIGNKCGYDVTDFRDGDSREFFASVRHERLIRELDGVEKQVFLVNKEASDISKKLKELNLPYGKEYRLSCGKHAAIIRNTENGYEYLELQSATNNGWKSFTEKERLKITGIVDGKFQYERYTEKCTMAETLKNRFGCRVSKSNTPAIEIVNGQLQIVRDENGLMVYGTEMELTAVDSYKGNQEFKDLLGYINTAPDKQKKGEKGYAK